MAQIGPIYAAVESGLFLAEPAFFADFSGCLAKGLGGR
jgi:hypothetical protein